jgi:Flp pilus assembly protein TadD
MDRRFNSSRNDRTSGQKIGLIVSTAIASLALAGCTTSSAPPAEVSFGKAQAALAIGQVDRAITHAEAAVLAEPRNAGFRAMLGASYLEAGRFQSAATSFNDALELGDTDPRTVLSYALAMTATGDSAAALEMLGNYETAIPQADLGLALALAGQAERGVHVLVNSVRNGENSAKARQNLAYTYALAGNWRAARVMAGEDVPADQLDARLSNWAATAKPEDYQLRVANLLQVTPVSDGGQPGSLALANFPSPQQLAAEARELGGEDLAFAQAEPTASEALAFGISGIDMVDVGTGNENRGVATETAGPAPVRVATAPVPAPRTISTPAVAAAPSRGAGPRFVSNAVVQDLPAAAAPRAPTRAPTRVAGPAAGPAAAPVAGPVAGPAPSPQRRMAATPAAATSSGADTHLVQLGSFDSRAVAESGWAGLKRRFPQLADHDVVITEAQVNGRTYFRVAAAGFGQSTARSLCNTVKSAGRGCFAYAASSPPAGAVDRGVRIAARTR